MSSIVLARTVADSSGVTTTIRRSKPQFHWGYKVHVSVLDASPRYVRINWFPTGQGLSSFLADLTHISKEAVTQRTSPQNVAEDHSRLLEMSMKTLKIIGETAAFQESFGSLLFHPDLHARNIFVNPDDPTHILGIIDWQSAAVEPAFVHALETPDFAEEPLLDRTLDADVPSDVREAQDHAQRCRKTWAIMLFLCPKLGKATTLDPALCRYLAGVSSGHSDDATALRSLLSDVSSEWNELGLPDDCPYQPSQADAESLSVRLDELGSTERLRAYLSRLLRCEPNGWVEEGRWDEVLPVYREQYAEFVSACIASREEDETEEDAVEKADRLWPFDLR